MVLTKWSGRRTGRSGAGEEPDEVEGALEGGARVCGDEAEVRICEATLSRTEEECYPTVRGVRAGESVLGAEKTVALGTGLAPERRLLITGEPPKQAEDRKKTESERLHRPSRTLTTSKTRALFRVSLAEEVKQQIAADKS